MLCCLHLSRLGMRTYKGVSINSTQKICVRSLQKFVGRTLIIDLVYVVIRKPWRNAMSAMFPLSMWTENTVICYLENSWKQLKCGDKEQLSIYVLLIPYYKITVLLIIIKSDLAYLAFPMQHVAELCFQRVGFIIYIETFIK